MKPLLIYYADDDIDDLNIVTEASEYFGHTNKQFFNGMDLLADLMRIDTKPDLILLDYFMPEADGLEILKKIRTSGFSIPVVMMSGVCPTNLKLEFLKQGANYIVDKPVSFKAHQQNIETLSQIDWKTFRFELENFIE